jgi:hypothetical protein
MAGDSVTGRTNIAHRLLLCAAMGAATILGLTTTAFAAIHAGPRISKTAAAFEIPATGKPGVVWTMYLRHDGRVVGSDAGTLGSLSVTVPSTVHGMVQADVQRNGHWYSGNRFHIARSGTGGGGTGGGGTGGGGTGGGGTGGGSSPPPTTVPPPTGAGGGTAPTPAPVDPVTLTTHTTPASGSALAFTGTGPALWLTALAGFGFVLFGAYLIGRRPEATVVRSLEALLRSKP